MAPVMSERSERMVLKDIVCPIVRIDKARRKDKSVSFFIAVAVHVVVLSAGALLLVKPAQFAVDEGAGSIEINLVAAPADPAPAPVVEQEEPQPQPETPVKKQEVVEKKEEGSTGKDQMTAQSAGGAITEAKPDYLKNPAPVYPDAARRRGQEGLVILSVQVDKAGVPLRVELKRSSGASLLDEAAIKAVRTWKFKPALLGSLPVESNVEVPVRFRLQA